MIIEPIEQPIPLLNFVLLVLVTLLPIGDLIATIFFAYLFQQSKRGIVIEVEPNTKSPFRTRMLGGRSWLLALLTASFAIITIVFAFLTFVTARRLLFFPPLSWTPIPTAILLVLLGLIPIAFTVAFWRTRRKRGSPPPFGDTD
jgi:hypothetical protein